MWYMQLDPPSLYNIFIATLGPYTLFNEFVCFFLLFHKVLACVAIALVLIVLASNSPYVAIFSKYGFESLDLGDTFIDLWSAAPFLDSPIIPLSICAFSFFVFYLRMLPPPSPGLNCLHMHFYPLHCLCLPFILPLSRRGPNWRGLPRVTGFLST
jgi:hypothetical protein